MKYTKWLSYIVSIVLFVLFLLWFIIFALLLPIYIVMVYFNKFIEFIKNLTISFTQPISNNTNYLHAVITKTTSQLKERLEKLLDKLDNDHVITDILLSICAYSVELIVSAVQLIDTLIHIAVRLFKLPYDLVQKTLEYTSKAITSDEMKQKKYSHFITKISLLTLTTFIYLQYSPKLSNNPISNYFKNLFNKLGIQLNKNALTASLISVTIFFVLFMFRTPAKTIIYGDITSNIANPLNKYQFTFFMMLSIAAGPIAYALNATLPASIVIGLAPFALALLMLVGNTYNKITISNQLKTLFPSAFGMVIISSTEYRAFFLHGKSDIYDKNKAPK